MNELEKYKQRIASAGGQAFSKKYKGTDVAKEFSKMGVEARRKKKEAKLSEDIPTQKLTG